ncbi:MAG: molybdopterin converting factor subunit 1 [Rhodocyclaceae bacterium]
MHVNVLYFASLREALGMAAERLELPAGVESVDAARALLVARGGEWAALARPTVRSAVNQSLAEGGMRLSEGDELAFFPPVTGG